MNKILLADDHIIVRSGLKPFFFKLFKDVEINEAEDGDTIVAKLQHDTYDLLVMDIHMPNTDSLDLMQFIHIKYPELKVLIFSMSLEKIYAKRFLKEGARGFISKDAPMLELKKAIDYILSGRVYISDAVAQVLAQEHLPNEPVNKFEKLSRREFEITSMLLSGQPLSKISKVLNLCASTVGTHKKRVFEKLEVANILELKDLALLYKMS